MYEQYFINKAKAKEITDAVNSMPIDCKGVCDELAMEHRTLQQNFTRLCFAWIQKVATDPCYYTDGRNEASKKKCEELYNLANEAGFDWNLPFI